jgi:hypothetical protein
MDNKHVAAVFHIEMFMFKLVLTNLSIGTSSTISHIDLVRSGNDYMY